MATTPRPRVGSGLGPCSGRGRRLFILGGVLGAIVFVGDVAPGAAAPLSPEWRAVFPPDDGPEVDAATGQNIVRAPDGSGVFVLGTIDNDVASTTDIVVVKYRPDGALDPTFGAGRGFATYHARGVDEDGDVVDLDADARALAVDGEGSVYVAGVILGDPLEGSDDALTVKCSNTGAVKWADTYNKNLGTTTEPDFGDEDVTAITVNAALQEVVVVGSAVGDGKQQGNILVLRYPLKTANPARDRRK